MQKPLEDWHGRPNSLKAFALRHWRVDRAQNKSPKLESYSFNFSITPMPFRDVCHKDTDLKKDMS